jgi:hypothetical protein
MSLLVAAVSRQHGCLVIVYGSAVIHCVLLYRLCYLLALLVPVVVLESQSCITHTHACCLPAAIIWSSACLRAGPQRKQQPVVCGS